eukprot:XP_019075009.1 PREDICTED: uncharacterized protein LOC109122505 isoform X1 [Vitis vinifera]
MGQFQQLLAHRPCTIKLMPMPSASLLPINAAFSKLPTSSSLRFTPPTRLLPISAAPSRFVCKMNGSGTQSCCWNFSRTLGLKLTMMGVSDWVCEDFGCWENEGKGRRIWNV